MEIWNLEAGSWSVGQNSIPSGWQSHPMAFALSTISEAYRSADAPANVKTLCRCLSMRPTAYNPPETDSDFFCKMFFSSRMFIDRRLSVSIQSKSVRILPLHNVRGRLGDVFWNQPSNFLWILLVPSSDGEELRPRIPIESILMGCSIFLIHFLCSIVKL